MTKISSGNLVGEDNTEQVLAALRTAILAGLEEIGIDCQSIASQNAPFDTGRLSASITHAVDPDELSVSIGTNVEYGPYQELGTSRGYKGWNGGKGYLRPAANENMGRFQSIIRKHLQG